MHADHGIVEYLIVEQVPDEDENEDEEESESKWTPSRGHKD